MWILQDGIKIRSDAYFLEWKPAFTLRMHAPTTRAIARALIGGGGGGVYSYIRVMPDGFLLKSVVFKFISKEISRAEHKYMNIHPPINTLATALPTTKIICYVSNICACNSNSFGIHADSLSQYYDHSLGR